MGKKFGVVELKAVVVTIRRTSFTGVLLSGVVMS